MALVFTAIIALRRLALQPMPAYDLTAPYSPKGDQPTAIEQLVKGVQSGERYQTLLGATGTGKTFTHQTEARAERRPFQGLWQSRGPHAKMATNTGKVWMIADALEASSNL